MTSALEHRLFGSLVQFLLGCLVIDIIGSNLVLAIGVPLGYVLSFCCLVPFFFNLSLYSWHARRVSFIATVLSLGVGGLDRFERPLENTDVYSSKITVMK